jgi:hypothetical protein
MATLLLREVRDFVVDVPLEAAWHHFARAVQWPSWARHIKEVEVRPPGELGPDSTTRLRLSNGLSCAFAMTEFQPYRAWTWVGGFLWLTIHYDHQFEELGPAQTRIRFVIEATGFGVSLIGRLFARVYNKNLDRAIPLLVQEMNATRASC